MNAKLIALLGLGGLGAYLLLKPGAASAAPVAPPPWTPPPTPPAPPSPHDDPPAPPLPEPQVIVVPDMPPSDWRPSNPNVSWIQSRLNELGFPAGPVDGLMGPQTTAGIRAFQEARGLNPTGVMDADTLTMLQGNYPAERPLYQSQ